MAIGLTVCVGLAACTGSDDTATSTTTSTTTTVIGATGGTTTTLADPSPTTLLEEGDYFDRLREVQAAVRASPDYLAGEIERLAATGDRDAILEFVRSHFSVVPPDGRVWVSVATAQWWGRDGALRSGQGTPREIAEVLAYALELAGFDTRIVTALGEATRPDILAAAPLPVGPDPGVDELLASTGHAPIPAAEPLAPEFADRLGANVLASLDDVPTLEPFTVDPPRGMPTVVIDQDGSMWLAGLWTAAGGFEPVDFVTEAADAAPTPELGIRVLVATADAALDPVEVASARVSHAAMVGRTLTVDFVPGVTSVAELLAIAPADVTSFVPTIRIGAPFEPPEILASGVPLVIDGRIVDAADGPEGTNGTLTVGEAVFGGTGDPAAASVVTITRANAWRYPWIDLDVEVTDGAGAVIDDLPGTAFEVQDAGDVRPVVLTQAITPPPRVVFLLDDSLSVPDELRDEAAADVVASIAATVQAERPDAEFRVAFMGSKGALEPSPWNADLEVLRDAVIGFGGGSGIWDSYADASLMGGDAIVVLTDGLSADGVDAPQPEPTPESLPLVLSASPAVVIGAGEFGPAWQGLADLTGGIALTSTDLAEAAANVLGQIESLRSNYTLRYRVAPDAAEGGDTRAVTVTVGNGARAETSYEVPALDPVPVGHVGIYLELENRGVVHTRTLAGIPFRSRRQPTVADVEDVRRAFFGTYTLIGEPGPPTPAALVDDAIRSALQWEDVLEASGQEQLDALTRVTPTPSMSATFALPLSDPLLAPRTVDLGMRFWLGTERPALSGDTEVWRRGVDLLPINRFVTLADDAEEVSTATITRSGRLSMLEALLFEISPAERLAVDDLVALGDVEDPERRAAFQAVVGGWPGDTRFLVPSDGAPDALAAVRPDGTLIAVGGTGEGVGVTEEEVDEQFDRIDSLLDMAGSLGGGPGAWAELEQAKMDKLRFATIVIIRMDADGVADLIEDEVCDAIGSAGDSILDAGIRRAGLGGIAASLSDAVERINEFGGAAGFDGGIPTGIDVC